MKDVTKRTIQVGLTFGAIVGLIGCLTLAATLPWPSVVAGIVVVGVGLAYRAIRIAAAARSRPPRTPPA